MDSADRPFATESSADSIYCRFPGQVFIGFTGRHSGTEREDAVLKNERPQGVLGAKDP